MSEKRLAHIARVTALLDHWSEALRLDDTSRQLWHDAGRYHDALRDAPNTDLQALTTVYDLPDAARHGPAAAAMMIQEGEQRDELLEAVRWHTVGSGAWGPTGRALYMADFLEPGRTFAAKDRAFWAAHVPNDFDGVFRQVVRARLEWTLREGHALFPQAVALWNAVR